MSSDEFYEISAVASMTGLSSHVLRVWERRYNVVEPKRSESKRRQYTRSDLDRLKLLKTLVDNGQAIGSIANLPSEKLEDRVAHLGENQDVQTKLDENSTGEASRIGLVGSTIRQPVRDAADQSSQIRIVGEFETVEELLGSFQPGSIDILFVEKDSFFAEDISAFEKAMEQLDAKQAVIVYRFAQDEVLDKLKKTFITALRGPVEMTAVQLALGVLTRPLPTPDRVDYGIDESHKEGIPQRVFSDEELVRIAKISSSINCECPQHISSLLRSLLAFEEYSEQCENRNEDDAELHRFLHATTAQCRHDMERALSEVLRQEGLSY